MRLRLVGPVYHATGYAQATREIALSLNRLGVEIYLEPLTWGLPLQLPDPITAILKSMQLGKRSSDYHLIIGLPSMFTVGGKYLKSVGFTMLEVDSIPSKWVQRCNSMDEIWVPSRFNQQTFSKCGVLAVKIICNAARSKQYGISSCPRFKGDTEERFYLPECF